jgi:hypothetical protein
MFQWPSEHGHFKKNLKMCQAWRRCRGQRACAPVHRYEQLKQEITTFENNLGFLNISSKKGNSLVDEMNRKVQKLKDAAELVRQKIKAIDKQTREEQAQEESKED